MIKHYFMVEFELPVPLTPELLSLVPEHRMAVNRLLTSGKIKSYSLAADYSKIWAIFVGKSEFEVMESISMLPLSEYMVPRVDSLAFHNEAFELATPISYN
ncbi:MAG: muconolactone Delta-isomerase family protein [Saprospiraceae bacterium]